MAEVTDCLIEELWISLQICDSGFPSGALAISCGLESAVYHGWVTDDVRTLERFVFISLEQAIAQTICFVRMAHLCMYSLNDGEFGTDALIDELRDIDGACQSSITNLPARRSSISQGLSFSLHTQTSLQHV
jgi:urease accessory protein UreF